MPTEPRASSTALRRVHLHDSAADEVEEELRLVAQAKTGDPVAFGSLLRANDSKMRGVAYRLVGDQTVMDDVLQDAYFKAFRSLDHYEPNRSGARFGTWLYRIVHSSCMDYHRRTARRPISAGHASDDEHAALSNPLGVDPSVTVSHRIELREALAQLPPEQAAVIALADGEGYSYEEVAATLGIKPGTVASRLSRARVALRRGLSPKGDSER